MRPQAEIRKKYAELFAMTISKLLPFSETEYWRAYRNGIEWCLFEDDQL